MADGRSAPQQPPPTVWHRCRRSPPSARHRPRVWRSLPLRAEAAPRCRRSTPARSNGDPTQAMVRLSTWLGQVVMTLNPTIAGWRDRFVRAALWTGPVRRYLTGMRFKPQAHYRQGFVAPASETSRVPALVGAADADGALKALLQPVRSRFVLLRPDRASGPWSSLSTTWTTSWPSSAPPRYPPTAPT